MKTSIMYFVGNFTLGFVSMKVTDNKMAIPAIGVSLSTYVAKKERVPSAAGGILGILFARTIAAEETARKDTSQAQRSPVTDKGVPSSELLDQALTDNSSGESPDFPTLVFDAFAKTGQSFSDLFPKVSDGLVARDERTERVDSGSIVLSIGDFPLYLSGSTLFLGSAGVADNILSSQLKNIARERGLFSGEIPSSALTINLYKIGQVDQFVLSQVLRDITDVAGDRFLFAPNSEIVRDEVQIDNAADVKDRFSDPLFAATFESLPEDIKGKVR